MPVYQVTHETKIIRMYHVTRDNRVAAEVAVACGTIDKVQHKEGVLQVDYTEAVKVKVGSILREGSLPTVRHTANMILAAMSDTDVTTLLHAAGIVPASNAELRLQQLHNHIVANSTL